MSKLHSSWILIEGIVLFYVGFRNSNIYDGAVLSSSNSKYSFDEKDKSLINNLRVWMSQVFRNTQSLSYIYDIKLENRGKYEHKNIDVCGEIKLLRDRKNEQLLILEDDTD